MHNQMIFFCIASNRERSMYKFTSHTWTEYSHWMHEHRIGRIDLDCQSFLIDKRLSLEARLMGRICRLSFEVGDRDSQFPVLIDREEKEID